MGKHKGKPDKDWVKAVKSAAEEAEKAGGGGQNYTLTTQTSPIRDYTVTLENPN
jgi:hypothetical protein